MSSNINNTTSQQIKHVNRNFRQSWKDEYPWLEYDSLNSRIFCTLCRACNKKNNFAKDGSKNIKLYTIKEHVKTKDHIDSHKKEEIIIVPPGHVISLMKIVYFMTQNDIPLNKIKPLTQLSRAIDITYVDNG
ncbi:6749_t:CDS:2 [Dentiscutata heterogama]|uniref:6749_t:CDS:1 n=1 Tax=Dentiscutata heterogama TaxID=1316150 RepID=A0ACA9LXX9_9GLOM|nr:6749_t:CDS:2 [Dentiscutata heterogama]